MKENITYNFFNPNDTQPGIPEETPGEKEQEEPKTLPRREEEPKRKSTPVQTPEEVPQKEEDPAFVPFPEK